MQSRGHYISICGTVFLNKVLRDVVYTSIGQLIQNT